MMSVLHKNVLCLITEQLLFFLFCFVLFELHFKCTMVENSDLVAF